MSRFYALGGEHFLAFELGGVISDLVEPLSAAGGGGRELTGAADHAARYLDYGGTYPPTRSTTSSRSSRHCSTCCWRPTGSTRSGVARELRRGSLAQAFAADQPDVRLGHIPIRHWDGYWFGPADVGRRVSALLVGPHAAVYLRWPEGLLPRPRPPSSARRRTPSCVATWHLRADGSASCAFVYPSCVNGQPAHAADPLANDQDWALVYALRHVDSGRA